MERLAFEEEDYKCEFDVLEEFKNRDKRVYYFNDGEYEGGWKYGESVEEDGNPHGYGVYKKLYNFKWPNGKEERLYRGEWRNGKKHGCGILEVKTGGGRHNGIYKGKWYNGKKFEGINIYGGYKYYGVFHVTDNFQMLEEGSGTATYSNGTICQENWQKGEKHGLQTCTSPDGVQYESMWRKGKLVREDENWRT